jgi:hypothetical protein
MSREHDSGEPSPELSLLKWLARNPTTAEGARDAALDGTPR